MPEIWGVAAAEDMDPAAGVVEVHLTASETSLSWLDGYTTEEVWAYNGQVPGPLIHAWLGDTIRVVFTNDLPEETTIHWHGLRIDDEMDGSPMIQDPVQPGETFTYAFTPPDSGSFWYHPHVRSHEQVERGLQGLLVVHEPDPVVVDRERYFALDDVYISQANGVFYGFTIDHMTSMHGRYGNTLLVNGVNALESPLSDTVRPDGVERWRLVNTANARTMWADVEGARWRVIAVDGTLLPEPYEADEIQLPIGRRFDLEVIPDSAESALQLQVLLPSDGFGYDRYTVFEGAIEGEPGTGEWQDWDAEALPEAPDSFEQEVEITLDGHMSGSLVEWTINGQSGDEHDHIEVQGNTPTRITIAEKSGAEHPFHLHGQFFQVLERNGEPADEPGLLDTVYVGGDDELTLWTGFDNPGQWMTHCHILEHAEQGMMAELIVSE